MRVLIRLLQLTTLFVADLQVDQDIKEQIAALVKKQKERNAERQQSSSRESVGSSAGTSGAQRAEETEQILDKRVNTSNEARASLCTTHHRPTLLQFKSLEKELRNVGDDVRKNTSQTAKTLKSISDLLSTQSAMYASHPCSPRAQSERGEHIANYFGACFACAFI